MKGEGGEIVGDTIRYQFDRFEICDCENSSGYLEDPATWPLGSHVFRRRLMKVMSVPTESECVLFRYESVDILRPVSCFLNHCSSTVCCFVDCVGEVFVSSVSLHISNGRGSPSSM